MVVLLIAFLAGVQALFYNGSMGLLAALSGPDCRRDFLGFFPLPPSVNVSFFNATLFEVEGINSNTGHGKAVGPFAHAKWAWPVQIVLNDQSDDSRIFSCGGLASSPSSSVASLNITCLVISSLGSFVGVCTGYYASWAK